MTKVKRNSKQIAGRSSHFCKQPLQKLSSSTPVAGLHSSVLSYAELIDYGDAAIIQTLRYFSIWCLPWVICQKLTLPSRYELILFSSNLSVPAVASFINRSSEFQLLLALEGSYVNGNCTEDADCKENMHASQLSREWSIGQLKINLQTPVNFR